MERLEGEGDVYPWKGIDLLVDRSDQLPFDDNIFDSVTIVGCLNHIPYQVDTLKEINRVIKPDGVLLITAPPPFLSKVWHKIAYWAKDTHERGMKEREVLVFGFEGVHTRFLTDFLRASALLEGDLA